MIVRQFIQFDHAKVCATNNEERRGSDQYECVACEIGATSTRHHRVDPVLKACRVQPPRLCWHRTGREEDC